MKLGWLKHTQWEKEMDRNYCEIAQLIGIDNFIKLAESFQKMSIYFTTAPFEEMLKSYISEQSEVPVKTIAKETGRSERYIQKIRRTLALSGQTAEKEKAV